VEDHLLQLRRDRRVRGTTDRRLEYAVGDLRGEREHRRDGSQRDPARSECVHVVLFYDKHADTRRACELHTDNLWQSHADPDGHSHGNSHSDSNTNGYSNSYAYTESERTKATSDTAASSVTLIPSDRVQASKSDIARVNY
jgi:hypothetical protein